MVEIAYGRLGTVGRSRSYVVRDEAEARHLVQGILKHRATAPRRLGVGYRMLELIDPAGWVGSSGPVGTAEVTEDLIAGEEEIRPRAMPSTRVAALTAALPQPTRVPPAKSFLGAGFL